MSQRFFSWDGIYGVSSKQDMNLPGSLAGDIYLQLDAARVTYGFIAGVWNHSIAVLQLPDGRKLEDDYQFTGDELAALVNGIDRDQYALAYTASSGSLTLTSLSVPEPDTATLALLALGALALRRRRHHAGGRA